MMYSALFRLHRHRGWFTCEKTHPCDKASARQFRYLHIALLYFYKTGQKLTEYSENKNPAVISKFTTGFINLFWDTNYKKNLFFIDVEFIPKGPYANA